MSDRAAFERLIDENPLESNSHLVYADYLDEQGEHDEAAFRRAMGEWINKRSRHIKSSGKSGFSLGRTHPWRTWYEAGSLPEGVLQVDVPLDGVSDEDVLEPPHPDPTRGRIYGRGVHWTTYRGMEEAFRQAFMKNRKRNPEHFARKLGDAIKPTE